MRTSNGMGTSHGPMGSGVGPVEGWELVMEWGPVIVLRNQVWEPVEEMETSNGMGTSHWLKRPGVEPVEG